MAKKCKHKWFRTTRNYLPAKKCLYCGVFRGESIHEYVKRRCAESRIEWSHKNHDLPKERQLYGRYMAFKEMADAIKHNLIF